MINAGDITPEERIIRQRDRRQKREESKELASTYGCGCLLLSPILGLLLWALMLGITNTREQLDFHAKRRAWEATPEGRIELERQHNLMMLEKRRKKDREKGWDLNDPDKLRKAGEVLDAIIESQKQ